MSQLLTLTRPSPKSDYGIYTGNGHTGAVLWGLPTQWHISLDRSDVWDLRQPRKPWQTATFAKLAGALDRRQWQRAEECVRKFSIPQDLPATPCNLNLGRLTLDFGKQPAPERFADVMDLREGVLTRTVRWRNASLRGKVWLDAVQPVVWVELRATGNITPPRLALRRVPYDEKIERRFQYPPPAQGRAGDCRWWALQLHDGNAYALVLRALSGAYCIAIEQAATTAEAIAQGCRRVKGINRGASAAGNRRWWQMFWKKSDARLSDPKLEQAWRLGLYQLACCSRPGGPPASLQGVWSPDGAPAPWFGLIFNNLNTQMCYWPAAAANHLELCQPFNDYFLDPRRVKLMEAETRDFFGRPGVAVPVGADLAGRRIAAWMVVQAWPMAGAWICLHLWEYFRHSRDAAFLRDRAYPYFKRNLEFLRAFCRRDRNGQVLIWPTHSPELVEDPLRYWMKNPTIDLWLLKTLLQIAIASSRQLRRDATARREWRRWLARVPDYRGARQRGYLTESDDTDTELSHRHFSCAAPVYPGNEIHIEGRDRDLAVNSVRQLVRRGSGLYVGYSHVWLACLAARVGLTNMAAHHLRAYWDHYTGPSKFHLNLDMTDAGLSDFGRAFYTSEPMSTESSIGAAAAVNEMLLQSWGGTIRVFPALPAGVDAAFEKFLAEDGIEVSARRIAGQVREVRLRSPVAQRIRLRLPAGWVNLALTPRAPLRRRRRPWGVEAEWNTRAGQLYLCKPNP